jgi:hypothetical protein
MIDQRAALYGPNDFETAFAAMAKAEAQAVIVQGLFDPHRARRATYSGLLRWDQLDQAWVIVLDVADARGLPASMHFVRWSGRTPFTR